MISGKSYEVFNGATVADRTASGLSLREDPLFGGSVMPDTDGGRGVDWRRSGEILRKFMEDNGADVRYEGEKSI